MINWERHQRVPYLKDGFWRGVAEDGRTAIVFEAPADDGRIPWFVTDGDQTNAKTLHKGFSATVEAAKLAAEAALQ